MKKFILIVSLLAALPALAQNVRFDAPFPSISNTTATPFLVANVPPNSPSLAVCFSPANNGPGLPCTNYATTYNSVGAACPNGAQDTPQPQPSTCQATGDAQGNIGFWIPPGTYDYTVTVKNITYGPFTITIGSASTSNATAIQGVPVPAPIDTTPGNMIGISPAGTSFVSYPAGVIDVRYCGLPTDFTDAWPKMKACMLAHSGATFLFSTKLTTATGCDYNFSDSLWPIGSGQSFLGRAGGPANSNQVNLCWTKPGVPGFIPINQNGQGIRIENLGIKGIENFSRTTASTFIPAFGNGYPGIAWITGTATGTSLSVNGTNEAWTSQTDNLTVEIYGAGAFVGTVSMATTLNSGTGTCTCTPDMIGLTVAVPAAGPAGGTLYAKIYAINGTTSGNAFLDQKASATVPAVLSNLNLDHYTTISSHSSASVAALALAVTTPVTNAPIFVGSQADGVAVTSIGTQVVNNTFTNWGRDGVHIQSNRFGGGASASIQLADSGRYINNTIQTSRGSGYYCQGADCNVGVIDGGTQNQNQNWGVDDSGQLINGIKNTNAAGNHEDCTVLPCPALGGATGGFKNTLGTWLDNVPYASANAPAFFVTDGTCTNGSNVVTTTATGKFVQGHADIGMLLRLTNCGAAGAADLLSPVTGFTNANSVTIADNATCGGSCPAPGAVSILAEPTINLGGAPFADPTYVTHTVLLSGAGADGQALVAKMKSYYSTTKFSIDTPITNRSRNQMTTMYFGATDYAMEVKWAQAYNFGTGALPSASSALTTTAANELFPTGVCNVALNLRVQFTIVGAGPGGLNHNATCSSTLSVPGQAATLSTPGATTVTNAAVWVGQDGGSYAFRAGFCDNCYEEIDLFLHAHKFGGAMSSPANQAGVPAVQGTFGPTAVAPIASRWGLAGNVAIGTLSDTTSVIDLYAGKNKLQQLEVNFCDIQANNSTTCTKNYQMLVTNAKRVQHLVGGGLFLDLVPGAIRTIEGDTAITTNACSLQFNVGSPTAKAGCWNGDGSFSLSVATGTPPLRVTSITTVPNLTLTNHPEVFACGTTGTCSNTLQASPVIAFGNVTLAGGTAAVTALPTFTSTTSFRCTASDITSIATAANAVPLTTSSITVTGTGTDIVSYICVGR